METLANGMVLQGDFSLSLQPLSQYPDPSVLLQADQDNEKFLKTSAIWHEQVELEELDSISLELRRQDLKITLLMEMVSELLIRQSHLPPLVHLQLTATDLQCDYPPQNHQNHNAQPLPPGTRVAIILYIVPSFPKALKLYGEVGPQRQPGKVTIHFTNISPAVQDRIEKLIFTQHRRSIAQRLGG